MTEREEAERRLALAYSHQNIITAKMQRLRETVSGRMSTIGVDIHALDVEAAQLREATNELRAVTDQIETITRALENLTDQAA